MIMEELLKSLESQIKALIDQYNQLKQSNQQLHHGEFLLACEKDLLLEKQQKTITQVQALISKLKTIEKLP